MESKKGNAKYTLIFSLLQRHICDSLVNPKSSFRSESRLRKEMATIQRCRKLLHISNVIFFLDICKNDISV